MWILDGIMYLRSMPSPIVPPALLATAFSCPRCNAYAAHNWRELYTHEGMGFGPLEGFRRSECEHCENIIIWHWNSQVYPLSSSVAEPNIDLPEEIRSDYSEAAAILALSPRGAAALLRLCVQKLCVHLELPGKNLNQDISTLVKRGLPTEIQQALDVVRVVGNNAVHPGEIDLNDTPDIAASLFVLLNVIADRMISQPKQIASLFGQLPSGIQQAVAKRDGEAS